MNRTLASDWFDRAWRGLLLGLMTLFVPMYAAIWLCIVVVFVVALVEPHRGLV